MNAGPSALPPSIESVEPSRFAANAANACLAAPLIIIGISVFAEANYSNLLAVAGISGEQMETVLKRFRKSSARQHPLVLRIHEADERMGKATLTILQLLESEWDQWNYDEAAKLVRFQNPSARDQYKEMLEEVKQAGEEETLATKRLAVLITGRSGKLPSDSLGD